MPPLRLPGTSDAPSDDRATQDTGNKVSRRSQIIGTQNIILGGKSIIQAEVIIRGDLVRTLEPSASSSAAADDAGVRKPSAPVVAVAIGRYCFLSKGCVLKPPGRVMKGYVCHAIAIPPPTRPHLLPPSPPHRPSSRLPQAAPQAPS